VVNGERLTLSELARRLGRAKSGLHKLAAAGQIPKGLDGLYDVAEVEAALAANIDPAKRPKLRLAPTPPPEPPPPIHSPDEARDAVTLIAGVLREEGHGAVEVVDFNAARTAETILKARLRLIQVEEAAGRLIPAAAAERAWAGAMVQMRARLLAVPTDVAQLLPHLTKHDLAMIDRALRDAMTDASSG